jgi:threonyl-tRNA synthetase
MFPEMEVEEGEHVFLRPMSCPHHCTVFKHRPRSYKELPIRFSEEVMQYRYEASGALIGLERVRGMQLTDAHIFLRPDQLEAEVKNAFDLIVDTLNAFDIDIHYIELALHDPEDFEKYHGDKEL